MSDTTKKVRNLKIRERELRGYVREVGGYGGWREFQVVDGRKIIGRFEIREAAEAFMREQEGQHGDSHLP